MKKIVLIMLLLLPYSGYGQQYSVVTKVGAIQVNGSGNGGVNRFFRGDGSNFPECTSQPNVAYADATSITPEGGRALLSVLLAAKAMNADVRVYLTVDASGYCRFQIVTII